MKISEFIAELEKLKDVNGDIEVHTQTIGGRRVHSGPEIAYIKILKGRESKPSFLDYWDKEQTDRKGVLVCRI